MIRAVAIPLLLLAASAASGTAAAYTITVGGNTLIIDVDPVSGATVGNATSVSTNLTSPDGQPDRKLFVEYWCDDEPLNGHRCRVNYEVDNPETARGAFSCWRTDNPQGATFAGTGCAAGSVILDDNVVVVTPYVVDPTHEPEDELVVCAFAGALQHQPVDDEYVAFGQCLLIRTTPFEEGGYTCWTVRTYPYYAPLQQITQGVSAIGEICVDDSERTACSSLSVWGTPPTNPDPLLAQALCVGLDAVLLPPCVGVVTSDGRQAPPDRTPVVCVS